MDKEFKKFMTLSELYVGDMPSAAETERPNVEKYLMEMDSNVYKLRDYIVKYIQAEEEDEKDLHKQVIIKIAELIETLWEKSKDEIGKILSDEEKETKTVIKILSPEEAD